MKSVPPRPDVPRDNQLISQYHRTCNLPTRHENPFIFSAYGYKRRPVHVFYRTTALEYGYYPPTWHTVPTEFHPLSQRFSEKLYKAGMFRNHSLNTVVDRYHDKIMY